MKVLVVYDITGTVGNVIYGSELEPEISGTETLWKEWR